MCHPGDYLDSTHVRLDYDDDCYYHRLGKGGDDKPTYLSKSKCGYSRSGRSFCEIKEGDETYTRTLGLVRDFWAAKPQCHINAPFSCDKAKSINGYYTTQGSAIELRISKYIMDNDKCVRQTFNTHYWGEIHPKMVTELKEYYKDITFDQATYITAISALATSFALMFL